MQGKVAVWIGAGLAWVAWTASAHAQPSRGLDLRWEPAPEVAGCPSGAEVLAAIEAAVGASASPRERVRVTARVEPHGDALRLELHAEVDDHSGRRTLEGPSCRALVEALSLIVAMLVHAGVPARPQVMENPYAPPNPYELDALTSYDSGWQPGEPPTAPPPALRLGLGVGVGAGALPSATASLRADAELCVDAWCPSLGFLALLPRSEHLANPTGGSLRLWLGAAELGVRYRARRGAWELGPLLGAQLGAMPASSRGVTVPGRGRAVWAALAVGAFARLAAGSVVLGLDAGAVVPSYRPAFTVGGVGEVFRTSPVSGGVTLTLQYELP